MTDEEWRSEAACLGADPNIFFPTRGHNGAVAEALAICRECPVRAPCAEYALGFGDALTGIWGGTTFRGRRRARRQRARESPASR